MLRKNLKKILGVVLLLISIPVAVFLLDQQTSFFSRAYRNMSGRRANIIVNLKTSYDIDSKPWKHLAQGGEERGGMLAPVINNIAKLEPDYIRIDHIYDFYEPVKRDDSGNLYFDWTRLDAELSDIRKTGAKPFISLSYMPLIISSGSEVDLPNIWSEWMFVVKNTIEHISGKNGLALKDVYYEVWNEPDLFGGFKLRGQKSYLALYKYSSLGADGAVNVLPFKFGGPATTGLYDSWFNDFINYIDDESLRLDFYSWHRYSRNISDFENDYETANKWLASHPRYKDIELVISEAGHITENDTGYDRKYSAIHTIAVNLAMFDKVGKVFQFEIKDGPGDKKYWGRWGILTHENFGEPEEKPRFAALEFLNHLDRGRFIVLGEGSWVRAVAAGRMNNIKVIVANYDQYNLHSETVPITFINLPSQNFIYRRTDFLGRSAEREVSVYDLSSWKTEEYFSPNSAAMLEIIAQ